MFIDDKNVINGTRSAFKIWYFLLWKLILHYKKITNYSYTLYWSEAGKNLLDIGARLL